MPIIRQDVKDGPIVETDGQHRGVIEFEFDDGRIIERSVRAADATVWANLLIDLPAEVEAAIARQDAEAASESNGEVVDTPAGQASREEIAVAYLRRAYSLDSPYEAFLKFDKFNNYRLSRGWNLNQVAAGLLSAGLTDEEWTVYRDAYTYLSQAARVTTMEAYQPIAAQWAAREHV